MKLSQYLSEHGYSSVDFARQVGVTPEAVRLWTAGNRIPRPDMMARIAEATGRLVLPVDFYPDIKPNQ